MNNRERANAALNNAGSLSQRVEDSQLFSDRGGGETATQGVFAFLHAFKVEIHEPRNWVANFAHFSFKSWRAMTASKVADFRTPASTN